ncbi:MAG: insulinase family protein [Candidatus Rokubacteria bacterium]|nr:insulinase family protein [Candidatus Rokubacteria bacterium]
MTIRRTTLPSGLRVVTEAMPALRSVSLGYWVATGSRDETDELSGASHFLEHLLFKGTDRRSAQDIAEAVEAVGGEMNAFTTKEYTAYYVRILDESSDLALDILSDVIWSPAFRPDEVDCERQVILEEIRMHEDTPDELVHSIFAEALFPDQTIGREVLGRVESIEAMTPAQIAAFHARHYKGGNVVVAAAGNLDHDEIVGEVERRFAGQVGDREPRVNAEVRPACARRVLTRPTEQAHLVLGMPGLSRSDPDRYALSVLNHVLGGGMSSRLFQEIRERRGLAYSVYSYRAAFEDTGMFAVYAGTAPSRAPEVLSIVMGEFDRLVADRGMEEGELERAKGHFKGQLALSLEGSSPRMERLGRSELTAGEVLDIDELVARIDAVGPDDLARVIGRVIDGAPRVLAAVGPIEESDLEPHAGEAEILVV